MITRKPLMYNIGVGGMIVFVFIFVVVGMGRGDGGGVLLGDFAFL